ncbi:MAG TPA: WD40 repeat domain-containing protein, partial [Gemmataceae bacterium]|nr:WD40 repeat domain-containing protein [Gemmataceae bacterium]
SGHILLWHPDDSSLPRRLEGHPLCAYAVAFAPDGQTLWSCSQDHKIKIWNVRNGELLHVFGPLDTPLYSLALSNDGRHFAVAGLNGQVFLGDASGQVEHTLTGHHEAVFALAFAPDGRRLASAGQDNNIRFWDSNSGEEAGRLEGHRDCVYQISFSTTGRRLTSVSTNGLVIVWDAVAGTPLFSHRFPGKTYSAVLSPNGARLAVGGADGEAFLMELPMSTR